MKLQLNESNLKVAMVTAVISIVLTVGALDIKGYLKHSRPTDTAIIEEFRLLTLRPDQQQGISSKDSFKEAFCQSGYLLLRPTHRGKSKGNDEQGVQGILVDSKNRGIHCSTSQFTPTAPAPTVTDQ